MSYSIILIYLGDFTSAGSDAVPVLGQLLYALAYKFKNLGQFCPLKIGGWGVDLYAGHSRSLYVPPILS